MGWLRLWVQRWLTGPGRLSCQGTGQVPPEQPFTVSSEWQEITLDLTTFEGCDVTGVQAIIFSAGTTPGPFSFQIDEVSFQ
jgi:hypothetical protein